MLGAQLYLSSQSRLPRVLPSFHGADKVLHAGWFLILALLAWRAGRSAEGWSRGRTAIVLLVAATAWGALDEWHQSFVPGRDVEAADIAADVAGAALAVIVAEPTLRRLGFLAARR
jgi:VanZ family protein